MLAVTKLTKNFTTVKGLVTGVKNLSFHVAPKEIFALIGPNGAGKTTTIKLIVGLYRKNSGKITLDGKDLHRDPDIKTKIGYIPDEPIFYPYLTGYEILDLVRLLYKVKNEEYKKRLEKLLVLFPIGQILSQTPISYSRGNKQKLSIIAALLHEPELLVIDEPIVGLDPQSSETAANLFGDFAKNGGKILVSTHTLAFVEKVANRFGIIDFGELIFEGKVSEIKNKNGNSNFSSVFMELIKKHKEK